MSEASFLKRRWKLVLNVVTLAALALVIYLARHELSSSLHHLKHVHIWIILLLIPVEALNYHAQAKLYQRLFRIVGNELSYGFLYRASLELNFVNHVFPSGGVTGLSFFTLRLRKGKELSGGKATLIHVMKIALVFLSFEVMILLGLLALVVMGRVNNLTVLVASVLSTLLVVGTALFVYIVGSKQRINGFFTTLTRGLNRLIHVVRRGHPETISIDRARGVFDEVHDNYNLIKSNLAQLRAPFWYGFLANLTEVAAVYVVYVAFGRWVNFGAVVLAYAVANFAGLVSVLPGGIGIYEALMVAVLASAGIPPSLSLPVTVVYRAANTLIQIPLGYVLYQRTLHGTGRRD